jgi:hypothetical protein
MQLNWRQIIIHFIASFCLMLAFRMLTFLTNIKLLETVLYPKSDLNEEQGKILSDVLSFSITISLIGSLGLLISFIISLTISLKKKWGWINSILVFLIIYSLGWLSIRGESITSVLFTALGKLSTNLKFEIFASGMLLITTSFLLFFSKKVNKFIAANSAIK